MNQSECTQPNLDLSALFEPARVRALQMPNRVLMAPMEKNLCTGDGRVTQRYADYLVARASVGLLRLEATYVDPVGKGRPFQAGAHSDEIVPALTSLVRSVHDAGGRVSLELAHCGRQTNSLISGHQPVAPSPVPCALSGGYLPRELTVAEIQVVVDRFRAAALRIRAAGVDAIEIHGASGYLLNAFLSPYTNQRTDEYGGTLENRARFPLAVVAAIREVAGPDLPVLYRMSADDYVPGGLTLEEAVPFAVELERAGVDLLDVSAGTYESITATQPPMEAEPGTLLGHAAAIKAAVTIPVSTAGKLGHLPTAARALRERLVDFVTIGRGLHADPDLLAKAEAGGMSDIHQCIACAECVTYLSAGLPAYCAVNAGTARERELEARPARQKRRVVVVGAGPAGMEAACAVHACGHEVLAVFEREDEPGGQTLLGAMVTGRDAFAEPARRLRHQLAKLEIPLRLATSATSGLVGELEPDVVLLATGGVAAPGEQSETVTLTALEYLAAERTARKTGGRPALAEVDHVAVIGGSWIGCHVAALLLEQGSRVTIFEPRETLAWDMQPQQSEIMLSRITQSSGATIVPGAVATAVGGGECDVWYPAGDTRETLAVGAIVTASRTEPETTLRDALADVLACDIHVIGDCRQPGKLADAILDGARAARYL